MVNLWRRSPARSQLAAAIVYLLSLLAESGGKSTYTRAAGSDGDATSPDAASESSSQGNALPVEKPPRWLQLSGKAGAGEEGEEEESWRSRSRPRRKRSVFEFGDMIFCVTGRSAWSYNNYGCYCGVGGGGRPVDSIDRCCRAHDQCYQRLIVGACKEHSIYLEPYDWHCSGYSSPICETYQSYPSSCRYHMCMCDSEAASCFARFHYPRSKPSC